MGQAFDFAHFSFRQSPTLTCFHRHRPRKNGICRLQVALMYHELTPTIRRSPTVANVPMPLAELRLYRASFLSRPMTPSPFKVTNFVLAIQNNNDNKHGEFSPSAKVAEANFSHFKVGHRLESRRKENFHRIT
ncbi:MAG: hypothetical protein ACJAXC_003760 [Sulfitobacter sp.]|jgi:hypothetical protein